MDPVELDYETDWAPGDGGGYQIGIEYNLGERIPLMCDPFGSEVIFTAGGKFYEWNQLADSVHQIVSPTTLDEIITVMKEEGRRGLKWKELRA